MAEIKKVAPKKTTPKAVAKEAVVKDKPKSKFERTVFDLTGKEVGLLSLPENIFGVKINIALIAQAIRVYQANQHQGNAATKSRGLIRGGGRKPWRQKGTGRARQGSIRSPQWRGGGIIFGPHTRDMGLTLPTRMKRVALRSALSSRIEDVMVVNDFKLKEPKTKLVTSALKKLNLSGKTLFVLPEPQPEVVRAGRNIAKLEITPVSQLNAFQVIRAGKIVLAKETVGKLSEVSNVT